MRRGGVLSLAGDGEGAALFHLGALTRFNELGLLAGIETIYGAGGGSVLGALVAARIPWPLQGAFRDWPEEVAAPLRELVVSRPPRRLALRRPSAAEAAEALERQARAIATPQASAEGIVRFVCGAAGLALGATASERGTGGDRPLLRWELRPDGGDGPRALTSAERARIENRGYLTADAALRSEGSVVRGLEPLPPEPPRPVPPPPRRRREMRPSPRRGGRSRREPEPGELLRRHRPVLQLDSLECYRPDPVESIAELAIDTRCNTLHRADGELIAAALPLAGAGRLDIAYLGPTLYADGRPVRGDDYLDEAGGSHASDALQMRRRSGGTGVAYGRAVRDAGRLWLQYFFFYYYNDKGFLEAGRHEGDWEAVQLRLGEEDAPDAVAYGRHSGAERAAWEEVERQPTGDGEAPLVYCARGSHASLLRAGTHAAPTVPDHNDGLGPRLRPRLVEIDDADLPGWIGWPGRWGSTRRREAFEGESPHGPARHPAWADPSGFHEAASPRGEAAWRRPLPTAPRLEARLEGGRAVLDYSFAAAGPGEAEPARILAAALAEDGSSAGTLCFAVDSGEGSCTLPSAPEAAPRTVRACSCSELGTPGPTVAVPLGR